MSSPETPDFKVTDRRQFRADGTARPSDAGAAPAAPVAPQAPVPATTDGPPKVTFAGFVASLGAQALSVAPEPQGGLDAVREIVAILEMLKDKTEGRRSDDETRILDGVLFELRMTFVSRASGSAPASPVTA